MNIIIACVLDVVSTYDTNHMNESTVVHQLASTCINLQNLLQVA